MRISFIAPLRLKGTGLSKSHDAKAEIT